MSSRNPYPSLFFLLLCLVMGLAAHAAQDDFAKAVREMKQSNFSASKAILVRLTQAAPSNGLYWFNLGSVHFNLKEYGEAASAFERVIALKSPLAPAAQLSLAKTHRHLEENALQHFQSRRFEAALENVETALKARPEAEGYLLRGLTLWRLGRTSEAQESFRQVLSLRGSQESQDNARFFLERMSERQGQSSYWLFVDIGLGYNSNLFLDGASEAPIGDFAAQTLFGAGLETWARDAWSSRLAYSLSWDETPGNASGRFLSQSLRVPTGIDDGQWLLQVSPLFQYQILETEPYLVRAGSSLRVKTRWESFSAAIQYEVARQFAQVSGASYLNGYGHSLVGAMSYRAREVELEVGYSLFVDDISDLAATDATLPLAGAGHGPTLRGLWYPSTAWELELSLSYLARRYRQVAQPGDLERRDSQYKVYARVSKELVPSLRAFVSASALLNRSTLGETSGVDDKNYSQFITLVGASWEILN